MINYYKNINSENIGTPFVLHNGQYIPLEEHQALNLEGDFEVVYSIIPPIVPTIEQPEENLFGSQTLV